ncbi:hypothetical protein PINS_up013920 [Pythium insidiosum]|nr:hypothetical protein PINS_up013920 [Pythium insidiosum]
MSDTLRTGLGMKDTRPYLTMEPDVLIFGPHAYQGVHLTPRNATSSRSMSPWLYKYDSTSVTMRSVAHHLQTPSWAPCVLTDSRCGHASETLTLRAVFEMLDALVSSVARHHPARTGRRASGNNIALRTKFRWRDRLFDHVLPSIFIEDMMRSSQAIYLSPARLRDAHRPVCGPSHPRPFSCDAQWTRFSRLCGASTVLCSGIDNVWNHLLRRWRRLQNAYPNATMDAVLLEGSDDYTRGGLVFHGRKNQDVVIVTRLRDCARGCRTIAVDDYRYEGGSLPTSVANWYAIVALLRASGQLYMWLRVLLLLAGSYRVCMEQNPSASMPERLHATIRTFFLVPAQVVVYGSTVPIACYVVAHLVDSSAVSQMIRLHFSTPLGTYHFRFRDTLSVNAKAMRSVWVMASTCHVLLFLHNRRCLDACLEVPGITEFLITVTASTTILARVRSLAWRDTTILNVEAVSDSVHLFSQRAMALKPSRTLVWQLLMGITIDVQFLGVAIGVWGAATLVSWWISRLLPRIVRLRLFLLSNTPVPHTAGFLWSRHALMVSWQSTFIGRAKPRLKSKGATVSWARVQVRSAQSTASVPASRGGTELGDQLGLTKMLLNLVAMTDPVTLVRLMTVDNMLVGEFETTDKSSQLRVFLPLALRPSEMDVPIDWTRLRLVRVHCTRTLRWSTLLQCG